jgi:hypothetical protein
MFGWLGTGGAGGAGGGENAGALMCGRLGIAGGEAKGDAGGGVLEAGGAAQVSTYRPRPRYAGT